jgi:hypothetical protein
VGLVVLVWLALPEMLPAALFCVSDWDVCPGLFCCGDACCGSALDCATAIVVASANKGIARKFRFIVPSYQTSGQSPIYTKGVPVLEYKVAPPGWLPTYAPATLNL